MEKKTKMKNFLLGALFVILGIPLCVMLKSAWFILPMLFYLGDCFGGTWLGFIIGIIILIATEIVEHKFLE